MFHVTDVQTQSVCSVTWSPANKAAIVASSAGNSYCLYGAQTGVTMWAQVTPDAALIFFQMNALGSALCHFAKPYVSCVAIGLPGLSLVSQITWENTGYTLAPSLDFIQQWFQAFLPCTMLKKCAQREGLEPQCNLASQTYFVRIT